MKFSTRSIVDSICRELLNEHGLIVMFTQNGEPIDRSQRLSLWVKSNAAADGSFDLPLSPQMKISEIQTAWAEILGFDVTLVELRELEGDDTVENLANDYFRLQSAGSDLSISPNTKFSRLRRDFREITGLGLKVFDSEQKALRSSDPLSNVGAIAGTVHIDNSTRTVQISEWLNSKNLKARIYSMNAADPEISIGEISEEPSEKNDSSSTSIDRWSLIGDFLTQKDIPEEDEVPFSDYGPFPLFQRIHDHGDAISEALSASSEVQDELAALLNALLQQTDNPNMLWRADTVLAMLEARDIIVEPDLDRSDVLSKISTQFSGLEAAKEELANLVARANESDDLHQSDLIDAMLLVISYGLNAAMEQGDEDILQEWIVGFGYGDYSQWDDEESVHDIMEKLEMRHRDDVVPAYMCFLKFNLDADATPDGEFRDEQGSSDWDRVIEHIVESCF